MKLLLNMHNKTAIKWCNVQEAERLTEAAANALLKTLEEPRPNTYFLLQADSSASLLATIYSRCQVWNLSVPNEQMAVDWLKSESAAENQEILTALAMNLGRPLLALETLQQGLIEQRKTSYVNFGLLSPTFASGITSVV